MKGLQNNRFLNLFRLLISVAALTYVLYRIYNFNNWDNFFIYLSENSKGFYLLIALQLLMSALNITLESAKWKHLLIPAHKQNLYQSLYQVLKGFQLGVITPARLGEPVARALLIPDGLRMKAFILSSTGSILQNIVLAIGGVLGIILLSPTEEMNVQFLSSLKESILLYVSLFVLGMIMLFLFLFRILTTNRTKKYFKKAAQQIVVLRQLKFSGLAVIISLTVLRYLVFCTQLWLMLWFFNITSSVNDFAVIAIYFTTITFIPVVAIADIGIRGSVALYLFSMISINSEAIIVSVFLLWIINMAFPVIVASFLKNPDIKK